MAYFQLQHTLTAPVPVQFQTLCESSRLYEPGSQFMEYVKRLPEPPATDHHRFVLGEPFHFEPCSGMIPPLAGLAPLAQCDETDLPVTQVHTIIYNEVPLIKVFIKYTLNSLKNSTV